VGSSVHWPQDNNSRRKSSISHQTPILLSHVPFRPFLIENSLAIRPLPSGLFICTLPDPFLLPLLSTHLYYMYMFVQNPHTFGQRVLLSLSMSNPSVSPFWGWELGKEGCKRRGEVCQIWKGRNTITHRLFKTLYCIV
jgi:hypothetical protein